MSCDFSCILRPWTAPQTAWKFSTWKSSEISSFLLGKNPVGSFQKSLIELITYSPNIYIPAVVMFIFPAFVIAQFFNKSKTVDKAVSKKCIQVSYNLLFVLPVCSLETSRKHLIRTTTCRTCCWTISSKMQSTDVRYVCWKVVLMVDTEVRKYGINLNFIMVLNESPIRSSFRVAKTFGRGFVRKNSFGHLSSYSSSSPCWGHDRWNVGQ